MSVGEKTKSDKIIFEQIYEEIGKNIDI